MATRGLIFIRNYYRNETFAIYKHYDAYDLYPYLKEKYEDAKIVNGIPVGTDTSKLFNGVEDLIIRLITNLKLYFDEEADYAGDVYFHNYYDELLTEEEMLSKARNCGAEYVVAIDANDIGDKIKVYEYKYKNIYKEND